jgi:hypothetical protein
MAGVAAVVTAAIALAATLALWRRGGGGFDTAWLPSWDPGIVAVLLAYGQALPPPGNRPDLLLSGRWSR